MTMRNEDEEDLKHLLLFRFWIEQGWKYRRKHNERMKTHAAEYKSRLAHEVNMIKEKDFVDYFLMVSDLVRYAKDSGIAVGPGRGSSAASLVCYLLRITEIDPMRYPMLFERFLDPTRLDEPDIDIDFEDDRRDEVFTYAATKYGSDRVANIGTFTRYKGKNSLDDIARVYKIPKWKIEAIKGKLLDRAEGHPRSAKTLVDTYDSFSDINDLVSQTPELNYASRLEGNLRGFGVHAAGMVISAIPLENICATYQREIAGRQGSAIAFDKYDASYLGLLKVDALSLQTMGMIAKVVELSGLSLEELYRVPLDDADVMEAFRKGDVLGIFQFEGITTRRILKQVNPTVFQHLSDVNALSRPGADDKAYVHNKNNFGDKQIEMEFLHPIMAQHLSWTYGVVVYEEQILMILRDLGGFAPAELNRMRKIIHDKLGSTAFNEYFQRFIKGAATHGLSETTAKHVWDGLVSASGYAFCVTGDTILERGGVGGSEPKGTSPKITVAELYSRQESKTPIGKKIRGGRLSILSMDDDGRVRPNKLLKIQAPVQYRCLKITTAAGRSITMSNDHKILTSEGYKVAVSLVVGDLMVCESGWAAREKERIDDLTAVRGEGYKYWDGMTGEGNPSWIDGRTQLLKETKDFVYKRDGGKCCHCGKEDDGTQHGLEFAHIMTLEVFDGDYSRYHDPKNVMLLCNSCHKKFDYQIQGTRNKRWSRGRPTELDPIVRIEDAGLQDVYDIFMAGPSHNYIGNEFVNHNNIAHSVSYAHIGYWQMWLKIHYPAQFYTGQLLKCSDDIRRGKIIQEALRRGIFVEPPNLLESQHNWTLVHDTSLAANGKNCTHKIVAGLTAVAGIGPKTADNIIKWRKEMTAKYGFDDFFPEWKDLTEVKGIGAKTISTIIKFCESSDPFGVNETSRVLNQIRESFNDDLIVGIPAPTHISIDIPTERELVCYMGIVRRRKYYDAVEQLQKRTTEDLSYEDALSKLDDPHLLKYVALEVEDEYGEIVKVRISRWLYPKFSKLIQDLKLNRNVIVAQGFSSDFGGISIQARKLIVIDPYQGSEV